MGTLAIYSRVYAVAAILSVLAACTTPSGSFCQIASPMRPSAAALDAMTDAEVAAMLAHNKRGQALCKWKP